MIFDPDILDLSARSGLLVYLSLFAVFCSVCLLLSPVLRNLRSPRIGLLALVSYVCYSSYALTRDVHFNEEKYRQSEVMKFVVKEVQPETRIKSLKTTDVTLTTADNQKLEPFRLLGCNGKQFGIVVGSSVEIQVRDGKFFRFKDCSVAAELGYFDFDKNSATMILWLVVTAGLIFL